LEEPGWIYVFRRSAGKAEYLSSIRGPQATTKLMIDINNSPYPVEIAH